MNLPMPSSRDRREITLILAWLIMPLGLAFTTGVLLVHHARKPVWKILGDPVHGNPLLGFFSNFGIVGWCAGASVALFSGWLLWRWRGPRDLVRFHFSAGAFTSVLMLDDFFLIHDALAPHYLGLGQNTVYALYAAMFVAFVATSRRHILARNPALFVLAVALLGLMVLLDALIQGSARELSVVMAGSKFLGIYAWTAWMVVTARRDLENRGAVLTGNTLPGTH